MHSRAGHSCGDGRVGGQCEVGQHKADKVFVKAWRVVVAVFAGRREPMQPARLVQRPVCTPKGKLQITIHNNNTRNALQSINQSPEADPVLLVHVCLLQRHHLTDAVRRKTAEPAGLLWNQCLAIIIIGGVMGGNPHNITYIHEKNRLRCNDEMKLMDDE